MKKKAYLIVLLLSLLLSGCGRTAYTDPVVEDVDSAAPTMTQKEIDVMEQEIFDNIFTAKGENNYSFTLDNVHYEFPFLLTEMESNGWEVGDYFDMEADVTPGEYASALAYKDGCEVSISLLNKSTEPIPASDCYVSEVRCVHYPWSDDYLQFESPEGFTFGATRDEVAAKFDYDEDEAINDPESSMYTMCRRDYVNINGYPYFVGEVIYVFEDDYLAQVCIEYKGE